MKATRMLIIQIVIFCIVLGLPKICHAEPMGTAFTYQGHLYDANYPANGLYDFLFKLYDANSDGNSVATKVYVADVDVIDGYFTIELDFGSSVFDGNARWLQIGVRPGELEDPNTYTFLDPRQQVTPAPYAIHAANAGPWQLNHTNVYYNNGYVGIGTTKPAAKLEVSGGHLIIRKYGTAALRLIDETPGEDDWRIYSNQDKLNFAQHINDNPQETNRLVVDGSGNVGIGTASPTGKLEVVGDIRLSQAGGTQKILTPYNNDIIIIGESGNPPTEFELMEILARNIFLSGDVGIGTTSPSATLDVAGNAKIQGNLTVTGSATGIGDKNCYWTDLCGSGVDCGCPEGYYVNSVQCIGLPYDGACAIKVRCCKF